MTYHFNSITVNLILTAKCNANCDFCYEKHVDESMPIQVMKDTVDFFYNLQPQKIEFWIFGGEPLTKPELVIETLSYILKKSGGTNITTEVCLFTNGITYVPEVVNKLLELKAPRVQISYEGASNSCRDGNNLITRANIKSNILKYIDSGILTQVRSTFSSDNFKNMPELLESIKWVLDCGIHEYTIMPVIESQWNDLHFKDWDWLFKELKDYHLTSPKTVFSNFQLKQLDAPPQRGCSAGNGFYAISLNGDVYACHRMSDICYSAIPEYKIGSIYEGIHPFENRQMFDKCQTCEVLDCAQCIGVNELQTNNREKIPDTGYCEIRKIMWKHYKNYHEEYLKLSNYNNFSDDEKDVLDYLSLIGNFLNVSNDIFFNRYTHHEFSDSFYHTTNIVLTELAPLLQLTLPLNLVGNINKDIITILGTVEKQLILKYNELFDTNLDYCFKSIRTSFEFIIKMLMALEGGKIGNNN